MLPNLSNPITTFSADNLLQWDSPYEISLRVKMPMVSHTAPPSGNVASIPFFLLDLFSCPPLIISVSSRSQRDPLLPCQRLQFSVYQKWSLRPPIHLEILMKACWQWQWNFKMSSAKEMVVICPWRLVDWFSGYWNEATSNLLNWTCLIIQNSMHEKTFHASSIRRAGRSQVQAVGKSN